MLILTLLFRPTGLFVADAQMSTDAATPPSTGSGFAVIVALLIVAPLVLPEFWRRFLTEILIWGLLAMSSDILIGYTGMVSFGHSAFFGLGMYGAAAALLTVKPPNLWLAIALRPGRRRPRWPLFVAYFSTRLRDIYFAITTLIFSQIFYVIIFTWTEVTGGENGLTFSQPALGIPGLFSMPFTPDDAALVRAGGGRRLLPAPAPHHPVAVRHGAAVDPRERGAHARHRLSGRALQDRGGDAVGPVRRPGRRALRHPEPFAAPDFVFFVVSGEVVIFNVMGGIGTLVGPIVGAAFFLLLREALLALSLRPSSYLIPVGIIFIADGDLHAAGPARLLRRWLNE